MQRRCEGLVREDIEKVVGLEMIWVQGLRRLFLLEKVRCNTKGL
jgi:hypothetical protein